MKKYLLFFSLIIILIFISSKITYSYIDCTNYTFSPNELSILNLKDYAKNKIILSFCSNQRCYKIKEDNIDLSISNFKKIYDKTLTNEEREIINVKGYPITKITVNNCK